MIKEKKKKLISRLLKEIEPMIHRAIDDDRTGDLTVFEMIMVTADTLNTAYKAKKEQKKETQKNNVLEFKRK